MYACRAEVTNSPQTEKAASGVIGFVPEKGKQYPPTAGLFDRFLGGFYGYEDRIDLCQDLRIIKRQNPAAIVRVVVVEDT